MSVSKATAALWTTRDREGRRLFHPNGLFGRSYEIRNEEDEAAVLTYTRKAGWTLILFILGNPFLLSAFDDRLLRYGGSLAFGLLMGGITLLFQRRLLAQLRS